LIYLNRVATIHALRDALPRLKLLTKFTLQELGEYTTSRNIDEEIETNHETSRFEKIFVAKIFGEMVATFEDLGALGHAIRNRADGGIFNQYLASRVEQVERFWRDIEQSRNNNPHVTLDVLLNLPSVTDLQGQLPQDILDDLAYSYTKRAEKLLGIGTFYRRTLTDLNRLDPHKALPDEWKDHINVILGYEDPAKPARIVTGAFNKIKHRFMVADDLPSYVDPTTIDILEYVAIGQDPQYAAGLIQIAIESAKTMSEMGAIIMHLDQAGVAI
jgi:hypothetical protein